MSIAHRGKEAIEVSAVFSALALTVVILRLYTRFFLIRCASIEDYLITLAMLCSIGLTICIGIQAQYGMGQHIWTLNSVDTRKSLKAFYASILVYNIALSLTKVSILLQYRRVFPTKKFKIACWSVFFAVGVYSAWTLFGSIFACIPIRAFWTMEPAKCIDRFGMWFANAAINIVTDLAIIILPMPVVKNLNLAKRQKQALIGIFAIGGFVCVVSILRLQSLVVISRSQDPTFDNPPAATWSSVETNVGITCSCLACLRPLMACWMPNIFSSSWKSGANSRPYGRSTYGRQSDGPGTMLENIDTKYSHGSSNGENRDRDIQVITEVQVRIENKDAFGHKNGGREKEIRIERESSTETLFREIRQAV